VATAEIEAVADGDESLVSLACAISGDATVTVANVIAITTQRALVFRNDMTPGTASGRD
jgi:hypothetical protein